MLEELVRKYQEHRDKKYDNDLKLQRLYNKLPKPIKQQLVLEERDGSATYESVKRRANYWILMNSTGSVDAWRRWKMEGDNEDDDGGQDRDSSGDLMGLKRGKENKERDGTMDTATSLDSGDTQQRIASRRRQCDEELRSELSQDLREWLQDFKENLVEKNVQPHQYSPSSFHESPMEPRAKVEPDSSKHSIFTHFPKDRNCDICQRTITRAPCRRRTSTVVPKAENLGDLITAHHKVLSEGCESQNNHRYAVVVQDLATQWIQPYPCETKTSQETERSLQKFLEPKRKPEVIHTDNSLDLGKSCGDQAWNHHTSTSYRSETNGIAAESRSTSKRRGTSAVMLHSGLDEKWWQIPWNAFAICEIFKTSWHVGKFLMKGRSANHLKGPIILCGAMVEYHPISARDQSRLHHFGKKALPGIFFGCALIAGRIWERDILLEVIEELEKMDASENPSSKNQCKTGTDATKESSLNIPSSRWYNKIVR